MNKKSPRGLTLIEVLVIVAAIGVFATLMISTVNRSTEQKFIDFVFQALQTDNVSFVAIAGVPQMSDNPVHVSMVLEQAVLGVQVDVSEKKQRGNNPEWDPTQRLYRTWKLDLIDVQIKSILERNNLVIRDGLIRPKIPQVEQEDL